jgi:hypothetical protein
MKMVGYMCYSSAKYISLQEKDRKGRLRSEQECQKKSFNLTYEPKEDEEEVS